MKIAIITAGGAGMFCGSCMQDNTLVRTLRLVGEDAVLVPTYTPIRVDEEDVSIDRVFMGGINVYLDSVMPGWKRLPRWLTSWLDRPSLISRLAKLSSTDATQLGSLTLDMLRGNMGPQKREIDEFVRYLCDDLKPDLIVFSNALLSGVVTELRDRFSGPIVCLLQGDDIFLEGLTEKWKQPVLDQLSENCRNFDGFLTHSDFYTSFMADYLKLDKTRFRRIPLSVDSVLPEFSAAARSETDETFRVGYFARICPEKGIQNLLKAATTVFPTSAPAQLTIAGFLPEQHRIWFESLLDECQAVLGDQVRYLGSPSDRAGKYSVISDFDLLCVPTDYREPKGLYVLEAGLLGVPCLLPRHGAFPELLATLNCGSLYQPGNAIDLENSLQLAVENQRQDHSELPRRVREAYGMEATAHTVQQTLRAFERSPAT